MKIEIKGLSKSFGKKMLFKNLNLSIKEKKITCLYGASGCGKTTILNIIGMIEPYDNGQILYDGKEILRKKKQREYLKNEIGFIFQDFGLLENETVLDNLKMVPKIKKLTKSSSKIEETLNNLNLSDFSKRLVYELSGGEQQRVAIAKILLKDPQLVLADEPTASLDQKNKQIVLSLLRKLQEEGKTVIIVSHDEEVRNFCDESIDLSNLGD